MLHSFPNADDSRLAHGFTAELKVRVGFVWLTHDNHVAAPIAPDRLERRHKKNSPHLVSLGGWRLSLKPCDSISQ